MLFSDPIEDLPLTFRLRTTKGAAKGLVILLHGVGSNENSMAFLARSLPQDLHWRWCARPWPWVHRLIATFG